MTDTPARALGILDRAGTLEPGRPADLCVMDVRDADAVYRDWWGGACKGNKVFVPLMTVKNGVVAYRQIFF